jgi:serine/threonine protein kinase
LCRPLNDYGPSMSSELPPRPPAPRSRLVTSLASPFGILIAIPALVLVVSLVVAGAGTYALRHSVTELAGSAFGDATKHASDMIATSSRGADRMLDAWSSWLKGPGANADLQTQAATMRALIVDRPGVAWISHSTQSGAFIGLHRLGDGRFQLINYKPEGDAVTKRSYTLEEDDDLVLEDKEPGGDYDPRRRPYWTAATTSTGTSWTEPYLYKNNEPGITAARALREADGSIKAVLTVDFSFTELSALTKQLAEATRGTVFVASANGSLLAWPDADPKLGVIPHVKTFDNPLLSQLIAHWADNGNPTQPVRFAIKGQDYLGMIRETELGPGTTCYVGAIAPLAAFLSSSQDFRTHAFGVGLAGVVAALAMAILLAKAINQHQVALRAAKAEIATAQAEARELGSYQMLRKLGEGGMGEVWLAKHRLLARPAAVKLIHQDALSNGSRSEFDKAIERFSREARTTAALRSRNTVEIYDYGSTDDGTLFLVMELLDGLDLHDLVFKEGVPPVGRTIDLLRQACRSLGEAHLLQLVHRDIKPGNIFVCRRANETDIVKVLDFGMALDKHQGASQRLTQAGFVSGTPSFMAPEQARALPVDGRSDIYALGCVAFFMLTGRNVFDHDAAMDQMLAHVDEKPVAPSERSQRQVPPELDALILRCLAKKPDDRPQTAYELEEALAAIPIPEGEQWLPARQRQWWASLPSNIPDDMATDAPPQGQLRRSERLKIDPVFDSSTEVSGITMTTGDSQTAQPPAHPGSQPNA